MKTAPPLATLLAAALAFPVGAREHNTTAKTGMSNGKAETAAQGTGVINGVDAEPGVVNITHGPIPALSWPEMTTDLPVTDSVDLAGISDVNAARFRVQLGADQVYRMTAVEAVEWAPPGRRPVRMPSRCRASGAAPSQLSRGAV